MTMPATTMRIEASAQGIIPTIPLTFYPEEKTMIAHDLVRVTVWNEFRHEKQDPEIARLYPQGMNGAIAQALNDQPGLKASLAALDDPEQGLSSAVLDHTDVLFWWGHLAHHEVRDELVDRVQ